MIQGALESGEDGSDFRRAAKIGDGVGNGVMIAEPQQGLEFLLVQFFNANAHSRCRLNFARTRSTVVLLSL